jgi:glycosyltransferase involved in cell wall biosynthesis
MALARSGVPFVYRSIGDPARWVNGRLHRARTGILFRRAAHVVPLWEGAGADIAELYGVSPDRITAIANARNPDQFRPATQPERTALRADFDIAPGELVVLVLGALEPEKRVALAIRTIASRPTMRLFIVGDGSERPQLERLAAAIAPDQVTFLGHVADPVRLLRSIDALILTSSTEGMPGVVLEAGLSEIPVVSTNVGMIDRLVVNGITGVVVDDPTVESLADGLDRCLAHRLDMGPAARAHLLGGYSWDAVIPQWGVLLGQVRGSGR